MRILSALPIFLITLFVQSYCHAQGEINANVLIDYSQVQIDDRAKLIIEETRLAMTDFLNNRRWTTDNFAPEERIRCNISINLTAFSGLGVFSATAQVQASRPIYGSSYESSLISYFDKDFNFSYQQGQPMDFNENTYINEITTLLGFYAYVIIGMDYDSYSKLGGTLYFDKARNIANNVPAQGGGWEPLSGKGTNNRATLAENLQSQQMIPMREGLYVYHRIILDDYLNQKVPAENHKKLLELLNAIKQFDKQKRPYTAAVRNFFFAKGTELMNLFGQASPEVKKQVVEICSELDPSNSQKYQRLMMMN